MEEYLDDKGEKIEKSFYKHNEGKILFYFTGKYDIEEFAIFEIEGTSKQRYSLYTDLVIQLSKINKEKLKEEMNETKERISWIEKQLGK